MVSAEPGFWRIEEEEGTDYLQFTCPLTELYSEIFDIPSALLFWRGPLVRESSAEDAVPAVTEGVIISEKKTLWGLRTNFIREGTFKLRALRDDEPFPSEGVIKVVREAPRGLDGTGDAPSSSAAAPKKAARRRKVPISPSGGMAPDAAGDRVSACCCVYLLSIDSMSSVRLCPVALVHSAHLRSSRVSQVSIAAQLFSCFKLSFHQSCTGRSSGLEAVTDYVLLY
jgi:hypothetical protein